MVTSYKTVTAQREYVLKLNTKTKMCSNLLFFTASLSAYFDKQLLTSEEGQNVATKEEKPMHTLIMPERD
jgi:hypothetical protein